MADEIHTHSVARGFVSSDDVVLVTSSKTRTIFRPAIHDGGVRGHIIRQKIGKDGTWADINEVNFNQLPADTGVSIELNTAGTKLLHKSLTKLYEIQVRGIELGDNEYVVGKKEEVVVINDANKHRAIQEILEQGYSEEFWENLVNKNPDLATRLAVAQIQVDRQATIYEFEASMTTYGSDEGYWQHFFEQNPWILQMAFSAPVFMLAGETYLGGKAPVGRNGKGGVATDFLFGDASTKNFSIVEIKAPDAQLVGSQYRGSNGDGRENEIYSIHGQLTGGVVQVRNQISVAMDNFHTVLGKEYSEIENRVQATGILVAGSLTKLDERQQLSFNHFRYGEHGLTIITFDELLQRLKIMFGMYDDGRTVVEVAEPVVDLASEIDLSEIAF